MEGYSSSSRHDTILSLPHGLLNPVSSCRPRAWSLGSSRHCGAYLATVEGHETQSLDWPKMLTYLGRYCVCYARSSGEILAEETELKGLQVYFGREVACSKVVVQS